MKALVNASILLNNLNKDLASDFSLYAYDPSDGGCTVDLDDGCTSDSYSDTI